MEDNMAKDPVCGTDVEEKGAAFMTHLEHETYYFCSKSCQDSFELKQGIRKGEPGKKWWQKILKDPRGIPPKCH